MASFAKLLNIELPEDEACDSRDILAALLGEDAKGLPFMIEEANGLALRQGNWKYIAPKKKGKKPASQGSQLYNLVDDPGEQKNVVAQYPEVQEQMAGLLDKLVTQGRVR